MKSRSHSTSATKSREEAPLRVGLVRLADAAPYVLAGELGYYREEGLSVHLSWELGWASIKHKIAYGQLDAAHSLASLPLSLTLGYQIAPTPTVALMVTSRLGNAITLSKSFYERGVTNTEEFCQEVRSSRGESRYTFGIVSTDSSHHILLRTWLRQLGLDPDQDIRTVVVPPGQSLRNLRAGTLDGYCVGEPWNSLAVREKIGWCPALSTEIAAGHPEKVLMARRDKVEDNPERYRSLVQAIRRACTYASDPQNIGNVARKMRKASVLGVAAQGMESRLRNEFDRGIGTGTEEIPVLQFCGNRGSLVHKSDMNWIYEGMRDCGVLPSREDPSIPDPESVYSVQI